MFVGLGTIWGNAYSLWCLSDAFGKYITARSLIDCYIYVMLWLTVRYGDSMKIIKNMGVWIGRISKIKAHNLLSSIAILAALTIIVRRIAWLDVNKSLYYINAATIAACVLELKLPDLYRRGKYLCIDMI